MLLCGQQLAFSQNPFITSWTTSTDPETISIPLNGDFTYNFNYVWKNSADSSEVTSGTHASADGSFDTEFATSGNYFLEITGDFPHFQGYPKASLTDVNQWGDIVWGSMFQTFNDWQGVAFSAADNPDLSQVTDMAQMFFRATSFNDDLSDWDVSNVTAMNVMFRQATAFNQNLSSWDMGNVTNSAIMFENADAFNQDLSAWNVSNVENMTRMFNGADNFNQDLSSWDIRNVGDMTQMLDNTNLSTTNYDNILVGWSALPNLQRGVDFDVTGVEACEAEVERFSLINDLNWNITDGGTCDEATNILSFEIANEQVSETVIDFVNHIITVEVFSSTGLTSLTPSLIPSEGALSSPETGVAQDFTNTVTYTVTAEDGVATQDWTVNVAATDQRPFITAWSAINSENITIELNNNFAYNFDYIWKGADGNEITSGRHSSANGDFVTAFTVSEEVTLEIIGNFPHLTTDYPKDQLLDVIQWGDIAWESMASSFQNWTGTSFSATDDPDLSNVTNMSLMFRGAANFDDDINDWEVANVTNMSDLFLDASSFNSDIGDWDVSAVTNMRRMFFRSTDFNQDLSDWRPGQVINLSEMFSGATNFTSDLSQWNVNVVTGIAGMFRGASNFNSDLNDWDVSQVTNMFDVFQDARSFNGNISDWNVSNVTSMEAMFDNADAFNQDLSKWNVSNVRNMSFMFENNGLFNGNIGAWNVENVTTMFRMFEGANAFNQDLTDWNPISLTNMQRMFRNNNSFNGDISTWNVENVGNMAQVFNGAEAFDQDLSGWNISSASSLNNIFSGSSLSPQNYDKILIGWAALDNVQSDVSLGADGITFCKAVDAKTTFEALGWTITDDGLSCLDETDILSFEFDETFFDAEIDATDHTVQAVVNFNADVTSLVPFITLSPGATISPESEELVNFADTVIYTVTAEDGLASQEWSIIVFKQPNNDFCTGAITVNVNDVVTGNTTFATNDSNLASNCGSNIVSNDEDEDGISVGVWYRFVGNGETITLNTCTGDKYDFDDTSLSVYTGSCTQGLICLAGNEDANIEDECGDSGYQARLSFNSEPGVDYFILVDGYSDSKGEFDLSITGEPTLPPPANDNCEEAETLTVFAEGAGTPTAGTNADATTFTKIVDCDFFGTINDVWYTFNSGANTEVIIDIALTDTDEDGELVAAEFISYELYDDCEGEGLDVCGGDGTNTVEVAPNTDYWLQLWNTPQDEGTFTIQINDGPNTAAELSFENAVTDAIDISRFTETGTQIDSVIADDDEEHAQLFSISTGNEESIFSIDAESGAITIVDAALLSASATTSFSLTILSEDQGPGEVTNEITLTVNVIDNAPPVVANDVIFIDENSPNDTFVAAFEFSDPDGDAVFPSDFSTNPEGILTVDEGGNISVLDESLLNFEANQSIEVTLTVGDDGPLALEATGAITVNLNDVNEVPELADTTFAISQFSGNGLAIGSIPFTDEDAGQTHAYTILDDGDNDGAIFAIDATTGELTVLDETLLSANGETTYTFNVEVTDNGGTPLAGTALITINTFGNNPPVIISEIFSVNENTSNGTTIGTLEVSDIDEDNITFSLESESDAFEVRSGNGQIRVLDIELLDFETNPSFDLLVGATDDGVGTLKTIKNITITLNDVNEVPEVVSAAFDISSFSSNGSIIGQIAAEDQDGDELTFSIASGNEDGIFTIDGPGLLSIADASLLDPIITPQHILTVEASDGNLASGGEVTINVFLNSFPVLNTLNFSIDENSESGAIIGTLDVTDTDGIDTYEITAGNEEGLFAVSESTGEIRSTAVFDFEEIQEYQLEVTITDSGLGNAAITEIITISINDINEFDPEVSSIAGGTILENSAVGTVAATIVASDADTFQTLAFSITAGNDDGFFAINESGEITTLSAIDFEQISDFSLTVEISDNVESIRTISEIIDITVTDVNETPLFTSIEDQTGSVGSEITFTVNATDPENEALTFSFAENSAQTGMTINETTGAFSWTPATDQFGSFELVINVSDGENTGSETILFTVLNTATDILSFELAEQTDDAIINTGNHTVSIEVAFGTDVTVLTPNFTLSEGASSDLASGTATDFTSAVNYTVTAEDGTIAQDWVVTVTTEEPNTDTDILTFVLDEQTGTAIVNSADHTVTIEVILGTDVTALTPIFTLSEGATSNPASETATDFTNAVSYTVTAQDGTTNQSWLVTVNEAPNTETDILTFTLGEQTVDAIINADDHTIAIEVAFGTDVTSLTPAISLSEGATSNPVSGATIDFTSAVTYTVTAEDGITAQDWAVTLNEALNTATDILTFSFGEQTKTALINNTDHTVAIEVAFGTDVTALVPTFTLSEGASSNPASGTTTNFTNAVSITVTAEDEITAQNWIVTVTIEEEALNTETDILSFLLAEQTGTAVINSTDHTVAIEVAFGTDVTALSPTLTLSEGATSDPASGIAADFSSALTYTVTAEDETTTQDWLVTVTLDSEEPNTDTDMLTFVLAEQTSAATINTTDHTVIIEVAFGTDATALVPAFTLSEGAISDPESGEIVDFTDAVTFVVTAEDGTTTQNWLVTVNLQEELLNSTDILTFVLAEQTGTATINTTNHTVEIEVVFGTDVTVLEPSFTLSEGASSNPASGTARNFTNSVTYTITAEDGTTSQAWEVTVTEEENPLSIGRETEIQVYPNPVQDVLHVKTQEKVQVALTDLIGRSVIPKQKGDQFEMNISHLKGGIYLLVIQYNDQTVSRKIFKRD